MLKVSALVLCIALAGCVKNYNGDAEFVCYTDDALSERHVGVSRAYRSNGAWVITYKEGQTVVYLQNRGEACTVEPIGGVK